MEETGHERVVSSLIDLQARLRAEEHRAADGSRLATVTPLPIPKVSPDRVVVLTERVDRLERDLSGMADRLREMERSGAGTDSRVPLGADGVEPDLALDLQRLVSERLRAPVDDPH